MTMKLTGFKFVPLVSCVTFGDWLPYKANIFVESLAITAIYST